jgi:hypothetical protein
VSARRKKGRPRVITPEVEAALIRAAGTGQFQNAIAIACGIHPSTLCRYLRLAERALAKRDRGRKLTKFEKELCVFCNAYRTAEAGPENVALGIITHGLTDARRVMENPNSKPEARRSAIAEAYNFLEHRYAVRWGRRMAIANETETEGMDAGKRRAFRVSLSDVPPEDLEAEAAKRGIADLLTVPKV